MLSLAGHLPKIIWTDRSGRKGSSRPMQISSTLYLQYAALSLLIVGGLVVSASWLFVVKSADAAARAWFSAVALQLISGMVLFAVGTEWRENAYFFAAIIFSSSLYIALYSSELMMKSYTSLYIEMAWLIHVSIFISLSKIFKLTESAYFFTAFANIILEIIIVFALRRIRTRLQITATLFAEIAFAAAAFGGLTRFEGAVSSGRAPLYTNLSTGSVIAMSLQCVLIIMSCFYYIGVSIQRAEARALAMRLEADQLRVRQKMAEDHARETQRLIEERDRMMILNSRFSAMSTLSLLGAGVVHEISQPLQAARSAMDVLALQKGLGPEELVQHSSGVLRLIDRAAGVVENLRRLIREKRVDQEDVDCEQLLKRVFPIFLSEAKRRFVEATLVISDSAAGRVIRANPVMLERIMFNLASNALEAFDDSKALSGERRLLVELRITREDGPESLLIGFHDTGKGVADANYDQMFELLSSSKAEGTGLGLYLVKTFVESWGGSVRAMSNQAQGRGTSIEIALPVAN